MNTPSFPPPNPDAAHFQPPPPGASQSQAPLPEQRARNTRLSWLGWLQQHSFAPSWLPDPLRHPLLGYLGAVLIELVAAGVTLAFVPLAPQFALVHALAYLGILMLALGWGAGPSLCATLVGALIFFSLPLPPAFSWSRATSFDALGLALYLVVGGCISLLVSRTEQERRQLAVKHRLLAEAEASSASAYQRLRRVGETLPSAVAITDERGRLVEVNLAFRRLWGESLPLAEELAPYDQWKGWSARTGQPLTAEDWGLGRALTRGEESLSEEVEIETCAGQRKTILHATVPMRDASGAIIGGVVNAQDISELRRLEREVAERAQEYEAIFESMADGVFVFDAQGSIRRVNAFAREILGPEESNWQGRSMEERFSYLLPRDLNHQVVPFERLPAQRVLRGEVLTGAQAMDLLYLTADGRTLVTSMSGTPLLDQAGAITGAVLVAHDVTERWRLEQRTYASLEALLTMAETLVIPEPLPAEAPSDFTTASLAQRVLSLTCQVLDCANATLVSRESATDTAHLVASVGFTPEQEERVREHVDGTRFADRYTDPQFLARLHAGEVQVLDLEQPPYRERRPLASLRLALVVPLRLAETLIGVMSLNQEEHGHTYTQADLALAQGMGRLSGLILERERLLGEREEARAKVLAMSETTRQMDAFLGIVSHELRTPVTSIKGGVQLLLKRGEALAARTLSPEDRTAVWSSQQQSLRRIEKQIVRLTRLLDDLIDLSRIRSGRLEVQVTACDLGALVAEVVEEERLAHPDRTIKLALPAGVSVRVLADADRTGQVLTNYLTNALKYSPSPQPVEVGLAVEGRQVRVWVRDQGPGIPPEEQAQLWNLFHRVPGIEVQSGSGIGLGLGLYISKTMMERQGGQVGVESLPGAGSTFWFTLKNAPDQ